jgi:type VI secretion system secreted protein VgrG
MPPFSSRDTDMNYLTSKKFSFSSDSLPPDTFGVVKFAGTEGISQCYTFEITLVSDKLDLDLQGVIENPAKITFHRDEGDDVSYHGILLSFEQLHEVNKLAFYRAHLVPRLTWLSFTQHNQVFLDKSVPEIIEACLKDGGLSGADFEMRLQGSYDPIEYVCQYSESHLNFVSRWAEREGIYYFFEQSDAGEKVVFTDTQISHTALPQGDTITYSPPSGLEASHEREIVSSFHCRMNLTPASVLLKDYNYRKPSLDVSGSADVDAKGRGQVYSYGDHIKTPEDGNRIAKIMAEGLLCRKEVFHGDGSVPYMMPGYTFTLKDHYRGNFNQSYLVTDVSHEGNQTGYLISGITTGTEDRGVFYRNGFSSIVSTVQFRPEHTAVRPRISGTLTAKIDAAGSGQYAELDTQGRYKVILPFDISGNKNGKASAWVRMAQPYAGSGHGMHFPLHKDTEVLLTFIDGDPDRPIIAAAVPNPETQSPVNVNNQTMSAITTAGGNKIHMEDKAGTERILMHSPNTNSFIRIGAPNDPSISDDDDENWFTVEMEGIKEATKGGLEVKAGLMNELVIGESTSTVAGFRMWFTFMWVITGVFGGKWDFQWPEKLAFKNFKHEVGAEEIKDHVETTLAQAFNTRFTGMENRISLQLQQDAGLRLDAIEQDLQTATRDLRQHVSDVEAAERYNRAIGDEINTVGGYVHAADERLTSVGAEMRQAGAAAKSVARRTATAGVAIGTTGAKVKRAGQLTQEAGALLIQ